MCTAVWAWHLAGFQARRLKCDRGTGSAQPFSFELTFEEELCVTPLPSSQAFV